ncbi:hypothetical protein [Bauldia sp.]|uniref:hypothetical protein n=1 Tax=Bauldia sp. TaxID=2575872 RepID=UPI003BABEB61
MSERDSALAEIGAGGTGQISVALPTRRNEAPIKLPTRSRVTFGTPAGDITVTIEDYGLFLHGESRRELLYGGSRGDNAGRVVVRERP